MTTTPNRGYGLIGFGPNGWVSQDLSTFNLNLGKIDGDVHALFAALSGKRDADASIGMDKVTGLNDALTSKAAAGHSHQLTDLSDVDAAQAGEGYLLARQAGAWVPVSVNAVFGQFSVNINSVDGLADALNGKAASDHNHDGSYYTKSQVDANYLGKNAKAADSNNLDGTPLADFVLNTNTNLGKGNTPWMRMEAAEAWAQPAGFTRMVRSDGSVGIPASGTDGYYGYMVTSRRDNSNGYSAILIGYETGELFITYVKESTSLPVWRKVWSDNNDGPSSGLNADLLDGKHGSEYALKTEIIPAGTIIAFAATATPSGYLTCYGQAVSRTTYAALFTAIGTTYGAGDGSTTFNVPDLRGEFLRGWDDGRGADPGRTFGGWQSASVGPHSHTVQGAGTGAQYDYNQYASGSTSVQTQTTSTTGSGIGSETRPRNVAVHFCIKY